MAGAFSFQREGLSVVSVCRKFNSHANSLKGLFIQSFNINMHSVSWSRS